MRLNSDNELSTYSFTFLFYSSTMVLLIFQTWYVQNNKDDVSSAELSAVKQLGKNRKEGYKKNVIAMHVTFV